MIMQLNKWLYKNLNDETSEDNLVLRYDSSPEKIKEKMTYYAKKIKIQREKLGLNHCEITVEHKSASLNNGVKSSDWIIVKLL